MDSRGKWQEMSWISVESLIDRAAFHLLPFLPFTFIFNKIHQVREGGKEPFGSSSLVGKKHGKGFFREEEVMVVLEPGRRSSAGSCSTRLSSTARSNPFCL